MAVENAMGSHGSGPPWHCGSLTTSSKGPLVYLGAGSSEIRFTECSMKEAMSNLSLQLNEGTSRKYPFD